MASAEIGSMVPFDLRSLQDSMGRVNHQPVSVHSFTNKRFTVNFRAPVHQVRSILPPAVEPDEIHDTGMGMFGMCACDFWVNRLGDGFESRAVGAHAHGPHERPHPCRVSRCGGRAVDAVYRRPQPLSPPNA